MFTELLNGLLIRSIYNYKGMVGDKRPVCTKRKRVGAGVGGRSEGEDRFAVLSTLPLARPAAWVLSATQRFWTLTATVRGGNVQTAGVARLQPPWRPSTSRRRNTEGMAFLRERGRRRAETRESMEIRSHPLACFSLEYLEGCRISKDGWPSKHCLCFLFWPDTEMLPL